LFLTSSFVDLLLSNFFFCNIIGIDVCCGCISFQSLEDVNDMEFQIFMDFLLSLSLFGENASAERMQELITIMENQADFRCYIHGDYFFFLSLYVCFICKMWEEFVLRNVYKTEPDCSTGWTPPN